MFQARLGVGAAAKTFDMLAEGRAGVHGVGHQEVFEAVREPAPAIRVVPGTVVDRQAYPGRPEPVIDDQMS
ncbi:hypothetical protein GCM10022420_071270 [Streptomyces iranensis]